MVVVPDSPVSSAGAPAPAESVDEAPPLPVEIEPHLLPGEDSLAGALRLNQLWGSSDGDDGETQRLLRLVARWLEARSKARGDQQGTTSTRGPDPAPAAGGRPHQLLRGLQSIQRPLPVPPLQGPRLPAERLHRARRTSRSLRLEVTDDDAYELRVTAPAQRQLTRLLEGTAAAIVDNASWLDNLAYIRFLRDYGPHFSINRMMGMDSVKLRLDREQPLSFLEFNYAILQAYDFLELRRRYGCLLQMGGSDQWGNIVTGIDLTRRVDSQEVYGLTSPLITTASGAAHGTATAAQGAAAPAAPL